MSSQHIFEDKNRCHSFKFHLAGSALTQNLYSKPIKDPCKILQTKAQARPVLNPKAQVASIKPLVVASKANFLPL